MLEVQKNLALRWLHRVIMCGVMRAGFTFVFSLSLLKLIKCNEQWLKSVLLSSMLKFCVLINVFLLFLWLYLWFSWISFGEIFQIFHRVCKDVFSILYKICHIDFPEKQVPTKVNINYYQSAKFYGISPKETWKNLLPVLLFVAHVDVIKHRKTMTFSFEHAQITWLFVLSSRTIVKL